MLLQTKGIVLKTTDYSESSVVAQIFTEQLGTQSYMIQGAKKTKAKINKNILQPLSILDMVAYQHATQKLNQLREAKPSPLLQDIPINIGKTTIILFLNEVLYKVLRHQDKDQQLFHFVEKSIIWLDQTQEKIRNFHLVFLIRLSRYLGFSPSQSKLPYFDLMDGIYTNAIPPHAHFIGEPFTSQFRKLATSSYAEHQNLTISKEDRKYLLNKIIDYYRLHIENFGEIRSKEILEDIFS